MRRSLAVVLALLAVGLIAGTVAGKRRPVQWSIRDSGMTSWSLAFDDGVLAWQWTSVTNQATPTSQEATVEFGFDRSMNTRGVTVKGGGMRVWSSGAVGFDRFGALYWTMRLPSACRATWSAPRKLHWQHAVRGSAIEAGVLRFPAWPMVLILSAYPVWAVVRGPMLRRRRRKTGRCIHCGYDLTGNESGACSECGEVV